MDINSSQTEKLSGRIKQVSINGFRSIQCVEKLELPQLSVLIGANGSGKSNFIHFFEMLGWMMRGQNLQEYVAQNGGGDDQLYMGVRNTPRIDASVSIETKLGLNDYEFALTHVSSDDSLLFVHEAYRYTAKSRDTSANMVELATPNRESALLEAVSGNQTARIIASLLKRCVTYQFHDTSKNAFIRRAWDIDDCTWLRSDGGNLASVLWNLQQNDIRRYTVITKQIARVMPGFVDFAMQPAYGKIQLRWRSRYSDKTYGPNLTSDGSLRMFCLITLLNMPYEVLPDVLFIDEPELGLHPYAIRLVASMIERIASEKQIMIATQSPFMVDCFHIDNIIVAKMVDGATTLNRLSRDQYQQWLDDDFMLSELWTNNTLESML